MSVSKDKKFLEAWLTNRYGSRRGFLRLNYHRLKSMLGMYQQFRLIDWKSINRVVFICKGNICRSAFAEAVARTLEIDAVSCGLDTVDGSPAHEAARTAAMEKGYNLNNHKTTQIKSLDLRPSDLLIVMEPGQIECLQAYVSPEHFTSILGYWSKPALPYIHDPYGTSSEYFLKCFTQIEIAVKEIAEQMRRAKSVA